MTDAPAVDEKRMTGAENVHWDLSSLYAGVDDPQIQADMEQIEAEIEAFANKYRGRIGELDAAELAELMGKYAGLIDRIGRLEGFASMHYSTDTGDPARGALVQKLSEWEATVQQKMVFFELAWNALDDADVEKLLSDPVLAQYRHYLEAMRRFKPHMLSESEEQVIMEKDVTGRSAWGRFFGQLTSAMRFEWDGEEVNMSQVLVKLHDPDRETRRKAQQLITEGLHGKKMELTYIFNVLAADKAATDRRRGYESWVSSRNLSNKAPDEVVEALVEAVTSNYDLVARHYDMKRVLLGLDELTDYDRYAPLPIKQSDKFYTWDEAREIVLNAFSAFSPRMGEIAQRFFDENWIDAPPAPSKRGGAYCNPNVPSDHPYVFLNYQGTANDVSTLAHELGHGIHSYLSAEAQGVLGLWTPLTTAEMASTFAEMLVFTDLMKREEDPEARLAMLVEKIEGTFATVYRQISMNRFEDAMHNARRTEGELTTERINEIWMDTQKAMFGESVTMTDNYAQWWSYVPHFVQVPGYVYAYSFGELLVLALWTLYQERGEAFVPQYIDVLAAGDGDWPENILAKVGVDLNDPNFWQKGLDALKALVDEEISLAKEVYPEKFA